MKILNSWVLIILLFVKANGWASGSGFCTLGMPCNYLIVFVLLEVKPGTGQGWLSIARWDCPGGWGGPREQGHKAGLTQCPALLRQSLPQAYHRGFTDLVSFGEWRWWDLLIQTLRKGLSLSPEKTTCSGKTVDRWADSLAPLSPDPRLLLSEFP